MSNLFNICCAKQTEVPEKLLGDSTENCDHFSVNNVKKLGHQKSFSVKLPKHVRLKNHLTLEEHTDTLNFQVSTTGFNTKCTDRVCEGSVVDIPSSHVRSPDDVYVDAQAFLRQYYTSIRRENTEVHVSRLREVKKELLELGTYQLKTSELAFGAKLAWRNASRCIGRIQWKKLQIFDCREVTTASGMFEALCNHIKFATNKGNIRSAITIFPQSTDKVHDFRIWNPLLISYAGYQLPDGSVLGDPARVEFTDVCLKLGWKPARTAWDVLPLVLSANGKDPEYFEMPLDIVMQVKLSHPTYKWFEELNLRWFSLPAVSNMTLECGGLLFTATAFNGWYMSTEIACRDLCDPQRYNITETVATKMDLDTSTFVSLWKDKALVEINLAVLHSFHRDNVSIVDHHSASEQFMKHLDAENLSRGGCPADWVWIVPPMSSSLTPVFHQEMANYHLKPCYGYQEPPWKTHQWSNFGRKTPYRKFHFRQIARAVKFASRLFRRALSKRIKATILYATETGKSEQYAKELHGIFGHAFNAQIHCMSDYDFFSIEHETLLLIVTSTFGNGEPPSNGADFAQHLFEMLQTEQKYKGNVLKDFSSTPYTTQNLQLGSSKALLRTNSIMAPIVNPNENSLTPPPSPLHRPCRASLLTTASVEHILPLSNVCFSVFALGSSAYPNFCNFGKNVDRILGELGAERILDIATGDELYGQEQQFRSWASDIFHVACETFCIDDHDMLKDAKKMMNQQVLKDETVRFAEPTVVNKSLKSALTSCYRKHIVPCTVENIEVLSDKNVEHKTIFVDIEPQIQDEIKYEPGDHVGVMPCNRQEIVEMVLSNLTGFNDLEHPVQHQIMKENLTFTGNVHSWENHERLPVTTIRQLFSRYLDITTPPTIKILKYLAEACTNGEDAVKINILTFDGQKYDEWKHSYYPHLGEVFKQFPSCKPKAALLAAILPPLQPRFYSISSSPLAHPHRIHMTVAVVQFKTQNGVGPLRYGVCSNYLSSLKKRDEVMIFTRKATHFHMPKDITNPLILVGPGTGISPFRAFWHHRRYQIANSKQKPGEMILFFGCRNKQYNLYEEEKERAVKDGILTKSHTAYSRVKGYKQKHVQAFLEEEGDIIKDILLNRQGHFYVCGDCKMAEEVQQTLKRILVNHSQMSEEESANFILKLMDTNRYHEDIFGITLRITEVRSDSRKNAKECHLEANPNIPVFLL